MGIPLLITDLREAVHTQPNTNVIYGIPDWVAGDAGDAFDVFLASGCHGDPFRTPPETVVAIPVVARSDGESQSVTAVTQARLAHPDWERFGVVEAGDLQFFDAKEGVGTAMIVTRLGAVHAPATEFFEIIPGDIAGDLGGFFGDLRAMDVLVSPPEWIPDH